jgi:hypothetical protein
MQISRHWRLNSKRYRLEGVRYQNGEVSLQERPISSEAEQPVQPKAEVIETSNKHVVAA